MTFDPTTNRIQWMHLTKEERKALKAWEHGWQVWHRDFEEWLPITGKTWIDDDDLVYRAKPAPEVKSAWEHVYITRDSLPYTIGFYTKLEDAKSTIVPKSIGIIRLDLIDGKLSVEVEQ